MKVEGRECHQVVSARVQNTRSLEPEDGKLSCSASTRVDNSAGRRGMGSAFYMPFLRHGESYSPPYFAAIGLFTYEGWGGERTKE